MFYHKAETMELSVVAYNAAISACEKGSRWKEATRLLCQEWSERQGHRISAAHPNHFISFQVI
jgi:pentatricopeptide repeat protein